MPSGGSRERDVTPTFLLCVDIFHNPRPRDGRVLREEARAQKRRDALARDEVARDDVPSAVLDDRGRREARREIARERRRHDPVRAPDEMQRREREALATRVAIANEPSAIELLARTCRTK